MAVEKPFGEDLESARALNARLARLAGAAGEKAVFRVDHVLGFHTVQNLLGLRLANRVPGLFWSAEHVEQVEILWEETLGLEGRAGFYDRTGALKDVMQNHMMQLLALVAMDPPDGGGGESELRRRKLDALRAVRPPRRGDMASRTRRARYAAGRLYDDEGALRGEVKAYADEPGVDASRGTETFAEVELDVESARWKGTRFVLRAGKALRRRRKGVWLRFRPMSGGPAESENALWVGIDGPRDISLHFVGSAAATAPRPQLVILSGDPPSAELPAYGRVLMDLLRGGGALSVGGDEAEEAWRIVTPVIEAWADAVVPLEEYEAGADGLSAARAHGKEAAWSPR